MFDPERYERFQEKELILRDQLAIDRTKLSADRTFLSYSRTALTMVIAGLTALHFVAGEGILWNTLAWLSLFGGLLVFIYGMHSYKKMLTAIERNRRELTQEKSAGFGLQSFLNMRFPSPIWHHKEERKETSENS